MKSKYKHTLTATLLKTNVRQYGKIKEINH